MNEILKLFLSMSFSGSLLIIILFLCKPFIRDRFSKRWQYYVWLIVIARLLLPIAPANSLMENLFAHTDGTPLMQVIPAPAQEEQVIKEIRDAADSVSLSGERSFAGEVFLTDEYAGTVPSVKAGNGSVPDSGISMRMYLWIIWLGGALILLIRNITVYQSFVTYIRAGWEEVTEIDCLDQLSQLEEQLGIRRPVELYTNSLISSPLLIGFFRPCIVLPTTELPDVEFQYTIIHELMHYKRLDMFYKWLMQITLCLHWFNPLVWLMRREIGHACELACDEAVIRTLDEQERREYGDTLLHAAKAGGGYKNSAASLTLSESAKLLKERMAAILSFQENSGWITALSVLLAAELTAGATVAGAAVPSGAQSGNRENTLSVEEPYAGTWYDEVSEIEEIAEVAEVTVTDSIADIEMLHIQGRTYYLIFNEEQLRNIPVYGLDKDYIQQADIWLSGEEWTPIGTMEEPFTGSYNGNGFEIAGLTMTDSDAEIIGLFGAARNAQIYNIIMSDYYIDPAAVWKSMEKSYVSPILGVEQENVRMYDNFYYSDMDMSFMQLGREEEIQALAEEYYRNDDYYNFGESFALMDDGSKRDWLAIFYDRDEILFFSAGLWQLEPSSPLIEEFAEMAYGDDKISLFSVLTKRMYEESLEYWLDRASRDENVSFKWVLLNALGREQEFLEQPAREIYHWPVREEEPPKEIFGQRLSECEAYGLTGQDGAYYYDGQKVRILMGLMQYDSSGLAFTLDMNSEGTVNIKVMMDADGRVTDVDYITKAEMKKWFGGSQYADEVNAGESVTGREKL